MAKCPATGKIRYPTLKAALGATQRLDPPMGAVCCPHCGDWHLTVVPGLKDYRRHS